MAPIVTVAGTHSGCGKTTVSLALMAAMRCRGLRVQPFKAGPDFIDPGHHSHIARHTSHNLDGWMMGRDACIRVAGRALEDLASPSHTVLGILEGVMGLFDGASGAGEAGSTAELAKWLNAPVILVVDARSMARSVAALVTGFVAFDPNLPLAGVVFNRVGSQNHQQIITEAMHATCPQVKLVGFLPRNDDITLASRHLGLTTTHDTPIAPATQQTLAQWLESAIDLDALLNSLPTSTPALSFAHGDTPFHVPGALAKKPIAPPASRPKVRIGIAQDEAFCFTYAENLYLLVQAGARLVPFSPLHDRRLPSCLHGLYLGGGYPELYAPALAKNSDMRQAILEFSMKNGIIYAECGGFMYLMQHLQDAEGTLWPLCGCLPFACALDKRFRALGYRQVQTLASSLLGPEGTSIRGHEFHYSYILPPEHVHSHIDHDLPKTIYQITDRAGRPIPPQPGTHTPLSAEGFSLRATLGSYVHLHFASNPAAAHSLVDACRQSDTITS